MVLAESGVLVPCTDELAAKYREASCYFSSAEAREKFLQSPEEYVARAQRLRVRTAPFLRSGSPARNRAGGGNRKMVPILGARSFGAGGTHGPRK